MFFLIPALYVGGNAATPTYVQDGGGSSGGGAARPIKHRPTFTEEQISTMEAIFKHRQYLSPVERESVASAVGLAAQQVRVWFQNRRQKAKQFLSVKQHQNDTEVVVLPVRSKTDTSAGICIGVYNNYVVLC